jgi:hypothetical protein
VSWGTRDFPTGAKVLNFFHANLTIAWVPQSIDEPVRKVYQAKMPEGKQWYEEGRDDLLKKDALWERYTSIETPEIPPHREGSNFRPLPRDVPYLQKFWSLDPRIALSIRTGRE